MTKEEQPYNQRDHSHCWEQENPPCGIKGEHRCCLCELPPPDVNIGKCYKHGRVMLHGDPCKECRKSQPTHHDWEEGLDFFFEQTDFRGYLIRPELKPELHMFIEGLLDQARIDENKRVIEMLKRYKPNIAQEIDNALVMEQQYKFYPH